jgi:hypothetical protein
VTVQLILAAKRGLLSSAAHPFCTRLNQILDHEFDRFVEGLCERFHADEGRPGLPSRRDYRLLIGYFEGLDTERAIAWRAVDSLPCSSSRAGVAGGAAGSIDGFAHASLDRSRGSLDRSSAVVHIGVRRIVSPRAVEASHNERRSSSSSHTQKAVRWSYSTRLA